jgi:succinate dehydrogenase / fumarate reductase cytochrome b subunit
MSTPADSPAPDVDAGRGRPSLLRRAHALAGLVPVGVFLVAHLTLNASALYGRDAFNDTTAALQSMPLRRLVEALVLVPLGLHALGGVAIALRGAVDPRHRARRVAQRVTGVVALAFIALHLGQLRVPAARGALHWQEFYGLLGHTLGAPGMFAAYLLGLTASVLHLANGLWLALDAWGPARSPRAARRATVACAALGLALWAAGFDTMLHFTYRCGGVVPLPAHEVDRACRDADAP